MPPLDDHFKNSMERTGNAYEELHHWIDDNKTKASEIHDLAKIHENVAYVRERWGEEAVREFVLHVKDIMDWQFQTSS